MERSIEQRLGVWASELNCLGFLFHFETRSPCVAQAGFELVGLSYPPTSASQVAGTTGAG
jgi:hypothetical protein